MMADTSVQHTQSPAAEKTRQWAAARKAERRRQDCYWALRDLEEALDEIGAVTALICETDCRPYRPLLERISAHCDEGYSGLDRLWRLFGEGGL
jgi:hypothetical protein